MVSRLFNYKAKEKDVNSKESELKKINGATFGLYEYFRSFSCGCSKKRTDNEKVLDLGRAELDKETFIVQLVQNQRLFLAAFEQILDID